MPYSKFPVGAALLLKDGSVINGVNVDSLPYVDMYGDFDKRYSWNTNNYILTDTVKVACRADMAMANE